MSDIRTTRFRVQIFGSNSSHGPSPAGGIKAIIDDAKDIGVSSYANDVGEFYMTLPMGHPALPEIRPLEYHYQVSRWSGSAYDVVGSGLIEDYDATQDEVVVYGHDYMGLLQTSITASTTSYSSVSLGSVVSDQLTQAIAESNSRLAFTSVGTIDATTATATLITAYEERLHFIQQIGELSMSDRSVRTLLRIPRETPWEWTFTENYGQDRDRIRLEYGGLVSDFRYAPGFRSYATRIRAIGIKREGATVLYSDQSYANETTYGRLVRPAVFNDITDQTALDRKTKRAARRAGTPEKSVQLVVRTGSIAPFNGFEIGDSVRVLIERGSFISLNALYTIWGLEWTVDPLGRENLYLDLATKEV